MGFSRCFLAAIGLLTAGCSLGLEVDDCTSDEQCFSGQACVEGVCQSVSGTESPAECVAFEMDPCVCDDGELGTRTCREDGTYTDCNCGDGDTGNMGTTTLPSTSSTDPTVESTSTGEPDSTDDTGSSTSGPGTDTGGSESGTGTGTDTESSECISVTPSMVIFDDATATANGSRFYTVIGDLGLGEDVADEFRIEFWFNNGAGQHDLGTATNIQYQTCTECVRIYEDSGDETLGAPFYQGAQFLQSEGILGIEQDPTVGVIDIELTGVRLVEVSFPMGNALSVPVQGGRCVDIADGVYATPVAPKEWTCSAAAYADLLCDCGCAALDHACGVGGLGVCESCNAPGSCDITNSGCPGVIDPSDLTQCDTGTAPEGWTCPDEAFSDGTCDCGCGVFDAYDCADQLVAACEDCTEVGACSAGSGCSAVLDDDNSSCG